MSEKQWYNLARTIVKAGGPPVPINETLVEILKTLINEEQMRFLLNFRKTSLNFDQIKDKIDLNEEFLKKVLKELMCVGMITGIPSKSTGVIVYRLVAFLPGLLEMSLMRGETGEKQKKLAILWEKLFKDMTDVTQKNYTMVMEAFKNAPPIDRVLPVEEEVELQEELVLPREDIKTIVESYDIIGVSHCYCRHRKALLNDPCKINAPKLNCLSFGKTAQFVIENDFAKQISREEALKLLKEAEDLGLVHKAFHIRGDVNLEEIAICNCCKCCCGGFQSFYQGSGPISTSTSYIAILDEDKCVGCGTCVEKCPMEAIDLVDALVVVNANRCIGCGVCAHNCAQEAMNLKRTGLRRIFVPAPIVKTA